MEICSVWVVLGTDLTIILFLRGQSTGSRQFWLQISWKFLRLVKVQFYLLKIQQNWVKISELLGIALIRILNQIWLIVILDGSWLLICLLEHQCCCKVRITNWLSNSVRWNVRRIYSSELFAWSLTVIHVCLSFFNKNPAFQNTKGLGHFFGHILLKWETFWSFHRK